MKKESEKFNEKELKRSYNKYYSFYRLKRRYKNTKHWNRFTLDKQSINTIQKNGKGILGGFEMETYPYKPYFYYKIIWLFMSFWSWIKKTNIKLKHSLSGGFFILIGFIIANMPNYLPNNRERNQEILDTLRCKEYKIQNLQTFSDSLLIEIKQKELIIKEFEQVQKDNNLKN